MVLQYTYLDLRRTGENAPTYPIWVREQGFGRNKSSPLTQATLLIRINDILFKNIVE